MKKHKISLRLRTFLTLLVFSALSVTLMTVLQRLFLDNFYERTKRNSLSNAMSSILSEVGSDIFRLQESAENTAGYYNVCVLICDESLATLASAEGGLPNCGLHQLSRGNLVGLYKQALLSGGSQTFELTVQLPQPPRGFLQQEQSVVTLTSLLRTAIATDDAGNTRVVFVSTVTTPLVDTVDAVTSQLVVVWIAMMGMALLFSVPLAGKIARPIVEMNSQASRMAEGDLEVQFSEQTGSRELDELGHSLNSAAAELAKVDTLRQELLANVSHDLRTPLTLITGYSEMMRDLPGENTPENLDIIIQETKRLSTLVNDVLDLSGYDTENLQFSTFCITDEVEDTIARIAKLTEHEGFRYHFAPAERAFVCADRTGISRVLYNLVGNAIRYSGTARDITLVQTVSEGFVRLDICDRGPGISKEELPRVFDRYYRSRENHQRALIGSGLGLSIVKAILEAHDARFGVDSSPGAGSRFWFALPQQPSDEAAPDTADRL